MDINKAKIYNHSFLSSSISQLIYEITEDGKIAIDDEDKRIIEAGKELFKSFISGYLLCMGVKRDGYKITLDNLKCYNAVYPLLIKLQIFEKLEFFDAMMAIMDDMSNNIFNAEKLKIARTFFSGYADFMHEKIVAINMRQEDWL